MRLQDKVGIITAAASGMGRAGGIVVHQRCGDELFRLSSNGVFRFYGGHDRLVCAVSVDHRLRLAVGRKTIARGTHWRWRAGGVRIFLWQQYLGMAE